MSLTRADLDAFPPPAGKRGWTRLLHLWPVILVVAFVLAVAAAAIAGLSSLLTLQYRNMISVGTGSCTVDLESGSAWVGIPMVADAYG